MASQDLEQRFGHLLRPIRDLASNWNIDLAQELEEYIDELEHVTVSFDGGKTSLNFAEAALVIQGSACVYSRKVEYLYSLIYQTLDHLAQQHKRSQKKSSLNAEGRDADAPFDDEDGLLLLDDLIKPGKNIDMTAAQEAAGMADPLGFPDADRAAARFTTPGNHLDSAGALLAKTPLSVIGSYQCHTASRGTSFNLTHCSVHESGALMLDANRRVMEMSADLAVSPILASADVEGVDSLPMPNQVLDFDDDVDAGGDDDGGGWEMAPSPMPASPPAMDAPPVQDYATPTGQANKPKRRVAFAEDVVDVWAQHDPFDVVGVARPLRAGRTFRLPSDVKSIASVGLAAFSSKSAPKLKLSAQLDSTFTSRTSVSLVASKPFFPALAPLHGSQQRRLRAMKRARRLAGEAEYAPDAGGVSDDDDGGADGGFDVWDNEADMGADPEPFDLQEGDVMGPPLHQDHAGLGVMPMKLDVDLDASLASAPTSYEELCRQHIAAFMRSASRFKEESGITKRVMDWQNRMEPILVVQESRPAFDIHSYGDRVMDIMLDVEETGAGKPLDEVVATAKEHHEELIGLEEDAEVGLDSDNDADDGAQAKHPHDTLVEFEQVVDGMAPEEVCRVFLATLQLANSGNVRLVHEGTLPDSASEHHLRMRLMNSGAGIDMETYRAPSALDADTPQQPQQQPQQQQQQQSVRGAGASAAQAVKQETSKVRLGDVDQAAEGEEEKGVEGDPARKPSSKRRRSAQSPARQNTRASRRQRNQENSRRSKQKTVQAGGRRSKRLRRDAADDTLRVLAAN